MIEPESIVAGWPMALSMASAVAAQALWAGRRRLALNRALHELRRPLQAVALAVGPASAGAGRDAVELATEALERLDREINGGPVAANREAVAVEPLLCAALERWGGRAALAGAAIDLRWRALGARVGGDRCELAQALDNLIANAVEHGGATIVLEAVMKDRRLLLRVVDRGARPRRQRRPAARELPARISGRRRRGHGLSVVRRVAAAHGGSFDLRRIDGRTAATIELPLLEESTEAA